MALTLPESEEQAETEASDQRFRQYGEILNRRVGRGREAARYKPPRLSLHASALENLNFSMQSNCHGAVAREKKR